MLYGTFKEKNNETKYFSLLLVVSNYTLLSDMVLLLEIACLSDQKWPCMEEV